MAPTAPVLSETIIRLRNLPPGKDYTYYRGNFDIDIKNSEPITRDRIGAPNYRASLRAIQAEIKNLRLSGKIRISRRRLKTTFVGGHTIAIYEYTAVGLQTTVT